MKLIDFLNKVDSSYLTIHTSQSYRLFNSMSVSAALKIRQQISSYNQQKLFVV